MRRDISLRGINLNLLPVLDEVIRQRNLTRAAETLNLTQSAVSNSLKLLREHFQDELLVRDGRRLRLTEFGESLRAPLEDAMSAVRRAVAPEIFDPATSNQRFRIATADYVMTILAPHLAGILSARAPAMAVQMLNARKQSDEDLRVGRIDMVIAPQRMLVGARAQRRDYLQDVVVSPLLSERLVCIGRRGDPDLHHGLTVRRYFERAHAGFFLDFDVPASLEQFHLGETGIHQFDRILTSSFSSLPFIVANSDCLALLPRSMARLARRHLPIDYVDAPIEMPALDLVMVWHRRREHDLGMTWLVEALRESGTSAMALD
ncbi:MAG: LysR family transcriptional regulator [Sphingomonadales bacterium]|nr:LysR family transcriptional regulator [Sphingomonadales bacterium]